ncbi:pectinesterase family protein [Flavobacterium sp. J27]|uniref:pectinesterase family protein n=1 Tax=Flavobacterium sp. J27 TaxID=2060419 RepID=UPI0010302D9E|nr:pectinesterase family protein [Flavobacterium sp. J27]
MSKKIPFLWLCFVLSISLSQSQNIDVWDFGATPLDTNNYNNHLDETTINSWYDGTIAPGSTSINFPVSFTVGSLSWTGNSGDRLRTTNTNLTRYDANIASVSNFSGRVYCNGTPNMTNGIPTNRFMQLTLNEDDEVSIISRTDAGGSLTFMDENNPTSQTDILNLTATSGATTEAKFVAKNASSFKIYVADGKASFYRIYRKPAIYTTVSGTIDLSQAAAIPNNYTIVFTNLAGKSWVSQMNANDTYQVNLPQGFSYKVSLMDANGFIITSGDILDLSTVINPTHTHDITILEVSLYEVTGSIIGLGTNINDLELLYTADPSSNTVYVPSPQINFSNATYSVQLEANIAYSISSNGVNDYVLDTNTITISNSNTSSNITFSPKPTYPISITTTGLTTTEENNLQLTFSNLNEPNYSYQFSSINAINLRDGVYSIASSGLDLYPVQMALNSNLVVNGNGTSKNIVFEPVTNWPFNDQIITTSNTAYKGLLFSGNISNSMGQGHLIAQAGSSIQIPANVGDKITIKYYYAANFSIENGTPISTINSTGTTSTTDSLTYTYTGSNSGYITIDINATTYFTNIEVGETIPYSSTITVGVNKDFATINEALTAVSQMERTNAERVTILIDPGNYEEMLVINQPLVTLKNAATNPSIGLLNAGVDIEPNAVRITSYYGHGYTYYSMSTDQKWHQDVLNVNIQNGYASYQNAGAGTTNGSYWNATVVIAADGFEAEDIIFENSFNQYISNKESQDVVLAWTTGSLGNRPTNAGNTAVQDRSFVERAAAIAIKNNVQKVVLNKCRVVGRQDSFYGGTGARVAVYKGEMMGAVDYIFGAMDVVFYQSKLSMNVSDTSNDAAYITAAQQSSGRGFLMYECIITTAQPSIETASVYRAKPGYFGRPWQANTSEVVFYNTTIETSNYPGFVGNSLIMPLGWQNTLGGNSNGMYEYGTIEQSGVNNTPNRASWSTTLNTPYLNDGTEITTFNFTKGNDDWDPFPQLIADDLLGNTSFGQNTTIHVSSFKNLIKLTNINAPTNVKIYALNGALIQSFETNSDTQIEMNQGIWIVLVKDGTNHQSFKVITF